MPHGDGQWKRNARRKGGSARPRSAVQDRIAGATYLRYTVLASPNKDETAVHFCVPALSVLVSFYPAWFSSSVAGRRQVA